MENLSRIAKGIFLGNGEVWNFLDYAVNRDCGGLMSYTKRNDFLGANLINNYDGGLKRRVEYSDIKPTSDFSASTAAVNGYIGEVYDIKTTERFNMNFLTKDEFTKSQQRYRGKMIERLYHLDDIYIEQVPESYKFNIDGKTTYTGITPIPAGREYDVNVEHKIVKTDDIQSFGKIARDFYLKTENTIKEGLNSERGLSGKNYKNAQVEAGTKFYYGSPTKKVTLRSFERLELLDDVAEMKRGELNYSSDSTYKDNKSLSYRTHIDGVPSNTGLPGDEYGTPYKVGDDLYSGVMSEKMDSISAKAKTFHIEQNRIVKEKLKSDRGTQEAHYKNAHVSSSNTIYYCNITDKVGDRIFKEKESLDYTSKKRQEWLTHFSDTSSKYREFASKQVMMSISGSPYGGSTKAISNEDFLTNGFGDLSISQVSSTFLNFPEDGLFGYNKSEREKYQSRLNGIKYPWEGNAFWTHNNSYGVEYNNKGEEYYSVNDENDFNGVVSLSAKYNGGRQSQYLPENGERIYSYYEEAEKDSIPTKLKTSTIDGSTVSLSDYNSASRLLQKTNKLFREAKIKSLINRFHTETKSDYDELTTSYDKQFGLSRGRNLLKKQYEGKTYGDNSSGYDNPYCRTWTAHHQYSKLKDRIRPFVDENGEPLTIENVQSNYGNLRTSEGAYNLTEYSVLRQDGFVRITPTHKEGGRFETPKNYMFSIENLAWRDVTSDSTSSALSEEQRGPNNGRIMWFPPYNLRFSENVNVNWNENNFIGRGEGIYTYVNTVRSGTLDFTLLIDHPSILNKWRGVSSELNNKEEAEKDLLRYFAGCGNINDAVEAGTPIVEEEKRTVDDIPKTTPKPIYHTKKIAYVLFFPNNFSGVDYLKDMDKAITILENYNKNGSSSDRDKIFAFQKVKEHNVVSTGFTPSKESVLIKQQILAGQDDVEIKYFDDLKDIESQFTGGQIFGMDSSKCKILSVEIKGFASSHGQVSYNKMLCNNRAAFMEKMIKRAPSFNDSGIKFTKQEGSIIQINKIMNEEYVNDIYAKIARAAYAIVNVQWKEENVTHDGAVGNDITNIVNGLTIDGMTERTDSSFSNVIERKVTRSETILLDDAYSYDNEYLYFSEIMGDKLVHKHIVDKVKYFDPAFHSITPEGFNARLTFLHQCTRQGPTNAVSSGRVNKESEDFLKFAGNLAFGRAPYCILRIGDFFNTKICIDSMSITYDNNGVQWDLNPEGAGVQPMYANISLSFKFLGGQDLVKPIERLQNAVTANYYANASVYSRHADNNKHYYDALEDNENNK